MQIPLGGFKVRCFRSSWFSVNLLTWQGVEVREWQNKDFLSIRKKGIPSSLCQHEAVSRQVKDVFRRWGWETDGEEHPPLCGSSFPGPTVTVEHSCVMGLSSLVRLKNKRKKWSCYNWPNFPPTFSNLASFWLPVNLTCDRLVMIWPHYFIVTFLMHKLLLTFKNSHIEPLILENPSSLNLFFSYMFLVFLCKVRS